MIKSHGCVGRNGLANKVYRAAQIAGAIEDDPEEVQSGGVIRPHPQDATAGGFGFRQTAALEMLSSERQGLLGPHHSTCSLSFRLMPAGGAAPRQSLIGNPGGNLGAATRGR
jgi:hypothetical protein